MRWYWWVALGLGGWWYLTKKNGNGAVAVPVSTALTPATTSADALIQAVQKKFGPSVTNVALTTEADGTLTFTGMLLTGDGMTQNMINLGSGFRSAEEVLVWAGTTSFIS